MSTWHVWGDYVHTRPERIGNATLVQGNERTAEETARARGFDMEKRIRNGFEPWAAQYASDSDEGQEFAFRAYPIVRGFAKV